MTLAADAGGSGTVAAPILVGGGFMLVGAVLLVLTMRRRSALARATSTAWGRVVAVDARCQLHVNPGTIELPVHHYPTVAFVDEHGQERTHRSRLGTRAPLHEVGQVVPVRYDPTNPSIVQIGDTDVSLVAGIVIGALAAAAGTVMLTVGLFLI